MSLRGFFCRTGQRSVVLEKALLIYFVFFLFLISSFYLILDANKMWPRGVGIIVVGFLIYCFFPRFGSVPPEELLIDKKTFPVISEVVEKIAVCVGVVPPPLLMTEGFQATLCRIGWRQRPFLVIGHGFLTTLDAQEVAALLAHEMGHLKDGTWRNYLWVRISLTGLRRVSMLIDRSVLLRPMAPFLLQQYQLFRYELLCDGRSGEYCADKMAANIAGCEAAISLLYKSKYASLPQLQNAYQSSHPFARYQTVRQLIAELDPQLIANLPSPASSLSHPSLQEREFMLQSSAAQQQGALTLEDALFANFQTELALWPLVISQRKATLLSQLEEEPTVPPLLQNEGNQSAELR